MFFRPSSKMIGKNGPRMSFEISVLIMQNVITSNLLS
jgi:hypothetical protein